MRRSREIKPYAAVVGMAPAETSDVKATWLGKIVQSMTAPKRYMTVTAFRGWRELSTLPIHPDKGRTPSRATANTRREAATIATLVLYTKSMSMAIGRD